jgi:hypothetical protein
VRLTYTRKRDKMNATESKCADRISEEMAGREAQMQELLDNLGEWEDDDIVLSIDTDKVTTVCLSYGGPADYLEITHNDNGIKKIIYRFSDWFDTATREVEQGTALWNYSTYILDIIEA